LTYDNGGRTIQTELWRRTFARTFVRRGVVVSYASIKDVAALAGVSFQTASKVLNGHDRAASTATERRVLHAARKLDYVPSALARRLLNRSNPMVGIISADLSDSGLSQFVAAAQREVHARGSESLVVSVQPDGDPVRAVRELLEHRVAGILVIAPNVERDPRFAKALRPELPVVSLNHLPGTRAGLVGSDHVETGALAAVHLLRRGHRKIGTVTGPPTREVVRSRLQGFRGALRQAGTPLPPRRVVHADWTSAGAHEAVHDLLDSDPAITAVFAQSDVMAIGTLRALADRGIRVPDDCSVVGCDDAPFAAYLIPALTTVRVPFDETGARAARLLLDRIDGAEIPRRELLPVRLIERHSTAVPARQQARPTNRRSADRPSRRGANSLRKVNDEQLVTSGSG
jgi:LacI family transcriptional regulator